MGGVFAREQRPKVVMVTTNENEMPFESPLSFQLSFANISNGKPKQVGWRVVYEIDVAHAQEEQLLLEMGPQPLATKTEIIVPGSCFTKLRDSQTCHALNNVGALSLYLHSGSPSGSELLRLTAVVEVFSADGHKKTRTTTSLRRRVYAPLIDCEN